MPASIGEVSLFADTNASFIISTTELYKSAFTDSIDEISGTTPPSPKRHRMFPAFSEPPKLFTRFSYSSCFFSSVGSIGNLIAKFAEKLLCM